MGIFTFAILSTLGLLAGGLNMNRDSVSNTSAASVAREVAADLQLINDWDLAVDGDPNTDPLPSPRLQIVATESGTGTEPITFYVRQDGTYTEASSISDADRLRAKFRVDISLVAIDPAELSPPVFHIIVTWPTAVAGDSDWPAEGSSSYEIVSSMIPLSS